MLVYVCDRPERENKKKRTVDGSSEDCSGRPVAVAVSVWWGS